MNLSYRDKLLNAEQYSPHLREKYEEEVNSMLEKKVSGFQKGLIIFFLCLGLVFTGVFGWAYFVSKGELPPLARAGFAIGSLFGIAETLFMAWILKRGSWHEKIHSNAFMGLTWGFMVITSTIFLLLGKDIDPVKHTHMLVSLLVFWAAGIVMFISHWIKQSELNTKEHLLRLELKIMELSEILNKNS